MTINEYRNYCTELLDILGHSAFSKSDFNKAWKSWQHIDAAHLQSLVIKAKINKKLPDLIGIGLELYNESNKTTTNANDNHSQIDSKIDGKLREILESNSVNSLSELIEKKVYKSL